MKLMTLNRPREVDYAKYPGWFFTNERLGPLITQSDSFKDVRKVFAIGASGDFAYSLVSLYGDNLTEVHTCDMRPIAKVTQDFKSATIRNLDYSTITKLWTERLPNESKVMSDIISFLAKENQEILLPKIKFPLSVRHLKKSKLWYRDSFWQVKQPEQYLGYLTTPNQYNLLKKNISKIRGHQGDFFEILTGFPDNYFDLIYTSNIFDNADLLKNAPGNLSLIHSKLSSQGKIISCISSKPKKMKRILVESGLGIVYEESHNFSIFSTIRGRYDYSYFLGQKAANQA